MNPNKAFKESKRKEFEIKAKEAVCWECSMITEKYVLFNDELEETKTPYCVPCFLANKHRDRTV